MAGAPWRRKIEVDHLHHSVGSLPFPAKRHGAHLSWGRAQPARRRAVLAGVDNVRKVVEDPDVLIYDADWATPRATRPGCAAPLCRERHHAPFWQVRVWHPDGQLLRVQTLRQWLHSGRSPGQDPHPLSGAGEPHRHSIFLRPGPAISVLLSPPDRVACPHPSTLVAEVRVHLGGPSPRGVRASHPRTWPALAVWRTSCPDAPCAWKPMPHSPKGLGMALWQQRSGDWRLLQCGSRHFTAAEPRYSATEVELLAVVWATSKAHLYLAGADFELLVDHRPLIPLLNSKTLDEMPSPWLTRLKEKLPLYRFTAVLCSGVEHKVADCFSRHPVDDPPKDDSQEDDEAAAYVLAMLLGANTDNATGDHILPLLDAHLTRLRTEANSDDKYKHMRTTVQQGFPANNRQLDAATAPFYTRSQRTTVRIHEGSILCRLVNSNSWWLVTGTWPKAHHRHCYSRPQQSLW